MGTYLQEGGPVTYVDAQGMPVQMMDQPVTYVDAQGMPVQMMYAVPPQPMRFNISAEEFAQIAAGGNLSQERINEMLSSEGVAMPTALPSATTTTAATTATKSSKKKVKVSK